MALKIRLQRHGTSHRPFYRMVVTEANARRDGRFVEVLGTYEPQASRVEDEIKLKLDRIDYWKSVGAKATDTAASLIRRAHRGSDEVVSVPKPDTKAVEEAVAQEEAEEPIVEEAVEEVSVTNESDENESCTLSDSEDSAPSDAEEPATEEESTES
tara:strand:- start:850 stop:1317 length:468 start_codon:yes stop_codon:yes gene_type:complete